MQKRPLVPIVLAALSGALAVACGADDDGSGPIGTGAIGPAIGGSDPTTGGNGVATGGSGVDTGGFSSTGGSSTATGGWGGTGGTTTGGEGPTLGGAETGGSQSGGTATGGYVGDTGGNQATGGGETCNPVWNPPDSANGNTNLPSGLDEIWEHSGDIIMAANNIKIRQIMDSGGSLKYCARWDSSTPINATDRAQIEALIARCDRQWTDYLTGWGCWPYDRVDVEVVIWAVTDAALLTDWSDDEGYIHVSNDASCPTECGPWAPNRSFDSCTMERFDEFFWLDGSLTDYTGWGSAEGFYMGAGPFLDAARANASGQTIVVHEMGHSHGMDDFYDWQPNGWSSWVMWAGSAFEVTETDGWMLRDIWRHVRQDYGYPAP